MGKRTGAMTNRKRIEVLLDRRKPDRIPIYSIAPGFHMVHNSIPVADAYNKPAVSLAAQRKSCREFGWVSMPFIGYASFGSWEFGGEIKWPSGEFDQAPKVARHAVETPEEAMKLKMPDVGKAGIIPLMMEFNKLAVQGKYDNEPFNLVFQLEGTFNIASNIAGLERFAKWLIKYPEIAHHLLRMATDYLVELAQYWKDAFGTDGVVPWSGEPTASNQIISPRQFEQFALPYLKETHERVLAMGYKTMFMHICGDQTANLPYWAQIPMGDPGFVSFGHEVGLETAAKFFPNDIIVGNLEPAIIQSGTPDEVYQATRKVVEKGKRLPGGFIFAPGCELPPMASLKNVEAMNRAVDDFGWYK